MRILMTGGGTAGHINPALAIAAMLQEKHPEAEFLFIGAKGRMETRLVPAAGYPLRTVSVRGFQRRLTLKNVGRNVLAAMNVVTSSVACARIIREFQPDIAIGTGGFVSGPVLREAIKKGIPTVVHESNAYPGVTVKLLAKEGATVLICSEEARRHLPPECEAIVTGNPLRRDFMAPDKAAARRQLGVDERPLVLSFGGSLGAARVNEAMAGCLALSQKEGRLQHIHGTGQAGFAAMQARLQELGVTPSQDIVIREYIDDMPRCMAAADLVICRCGAMTISELPAAGKPSILIPSPYVAENHQYHNAMVLVNRQAAVCIEEKELTAERLWEVIRELTADKEKLTAMAENARRAAVLDADERIYRVLAQKLGLLEENQ